VIGAETQQRNYKLHFDCDARKKHHQIVSGLAHDYKIVDG
jgi:hypothetical protein